MCKIRIRYNGFLLENVKITHILLKIPVNNGEELQVFVPPQQEIIIDLPQNVSHFIISFNKGPYSLVFVSRKSILFGIFSKIDFSYDNSLIKIQRIKKNFFELIV